MNRIDRNYENKKLVLDEMDNISNLRLKLIDDMMKTYSPIEFITNIFKKIK